MVSKKLWVGVNILYLVIRKPGQRIFDWINPTSGLQSGKILRIQNMKHTKDYSSIYVNIWSGCLLA